MTKSIILITGNVCDCNVASDWPSLHCFTPRVFLFSISLLFRRLLEIQAYTCLSHNIVN